MKAASRLAANILAAFASIAATIQRWKVPIATIAIGLTANKLYDLFFDYVLYVFVINYFGLQDGFIIMTVISLLTSLCFILFYDWLKKDWLGIEMLKEIQENMTDKPKRTSVIAKILWFPIDIVRTLLRWSLGKGTFVTFVVLSIQFDPFITTVYMRKGSKKYNGMSRRDWMIFLGSVAFGNLFWSGSVAAVSEFIRYLFQW